MNLSISTGMSFLVQRTNSTRLFATSLPIVSRDKLLIVMD